MKTETLKENREINRKHGKLNSTRFARDTEVSTQGLSKQALSKIAGNFPDDEDADFDAWRLSLSGA